MKKSIKILLISLASLLVLGIVLIGFIWLSRDSIKQLVVKQLNEQLSAPISVRGIDITFLDQFPRVSLLFRDVEIADPIRPKQILLKAKRVFIAFNINDILTKRYNIKLIEIDSGSCNLFIDSKNKPNYLILKPTNEPSADLLLELKRIKLQHMILAYDNLASQQQYHLRADNLILSGDFKGKKEKISANGSVFIQTLTSNTVTFLKNKKIELDLGLNIDESQSRYTIEKGNIALGNLDLAFIGSIANTQKTTLIDLKFNAQKIAITDLLELLPGNMSHSFSGYKSTGSIYFNGSIKGNASNKEQPAIQLQFGITDGKLEASSEKIAITNIQCKGEFNNGSNHTAQTSYVLLPSLRFRLGNGQFEGSLNIRDFSNPNLSMMLKGKTTLTDLIAFTESKWITKAEGELNIDLAVKGNIHELSTQKGLLNSQTSGTIECTANNIVFFSGEKNIEQLKTKFSLNNKDLIIDYLTASINKSDIQLKGSLQNIVPYLFSEKQNLIANIQYKSNYINLQYLVLPIPSTTTSNTFTLPQNITVNAALNINQLDYHDFNAKNIKGDIYWSGKKIETQNLFCETMKGQLKVKGQIENAADGRFLVSSTINCTQVDINELFRQCANFGQTEITDAHIHGNMTANIDVLGVWSPALVCDLDKLYALGNVHITNGQLINYQPMEALAKYINIEDLRNVKFADLKNTIEIKNKVITIPTMDMQNNALNINIAGRHTFNNYVDYHLKIKLSDVLAKKYAKRNNEFEEENLENGTYLYIAMKGPVENIKFSYDKKQVREQVKKELKEEKEEVKKLWKKELGLEKDESIKEQQNDKNELEFEPE